MRKWETKQLFARPCIYSARKPPFRYLNISKENVYLGFLVSMAPRKPIILLVHGGWHTLEHYRTFLSILEAKGYTVVAPDLPSSLEPTPDNPAEADIKLFSDTARVLADEGNEIVAVVHSYGGVVATEAFSGLGIKARKAHDLHGGIRSIICIAAFLLGKEMTLEGSAPAEMLGWCAYKVSRLIFVPWREMPLTVSIG